MNAQLHLPLRPAQAPAPIRPTMHCPTASPLDAWLRLEDLCWRLRSEGLRVSFIGKTLQVEGLRRATLPADLRNAVLDTDTYAWAMEGAHGAVVSTLNYSGLDLVITLPPEAAVRSWPEAEAVLQLRAAFAIALVRRSLQ